MHVFIEKIKSLFGSEQDFYSSSYISHIYKICLIIYGILVYGILLWYAYTFILVVDEREHLTASFYVYSGQVPYRDFFEHHHPLLWYIFAPVLNFCDNTPYIWYIIRTYALLWIFLNCIVVYKLSQLIAQNKGFSILAVLFSVAPHCIYVTNIAFRPDGFMSLFLLIGVYFFLKYLQSKRYLMLQMAIISFFISFMFLQKVLIFLFFIALLMLLLVYKKEVKIKDILISSIVPLSIYLGYIFYMYQIGALKDYWELNFLLNIKAHYVFTYPISHTVYFYIANAVALYILFTKQPNILQYIAFLAVSFSFILFFLGTFEHYWIPLYSYFAIVCAYMINRLKDKWRVCAMVIITICTLIDDAFGLYGQKTFPYLQFYVEQSKTVLRVAKKNDYILGDLKVIGGLRQDVAGYYWFGRDYMGLIDNHYFNRHPLPDANKLLKEKKPKILSYMNWFNCMREDFSTDQDCVMIEDTFDPKYLKEHYFKDGMFWIRKD